MIFRLFYNLSFIYKNFDGKAYGIGDVAKDEEYNTV